MLVTDCTLKLNSPETFATQVLLDHDLVLPDITSHRSATSSRACQPTATPDEGGPHVQKYPQSLFSKVEDNEHHTWESASDTTHSIEGFSTAYCIIPVDVAESDCIPRFQKQHSFAYSRTCVNNNSSTSPVINLDSSAMKSSTSSITDAPQAIAVSAVQAGTRDLPDASTVSGQILLNAFDEMYVQVRPKPEQEHSRSIVRRSLLPAALEGKHSLADALDQVESSDVGSTAFAVDCPTVRSEPGKPAIKVKEVESSCCEPEPVSSSVDEACMPPVTCYICSTKVRETSCGWDEPEPRSSAVDAEAILPPQRDAKIGASVMPNQYTHDCDATDKEVHTMSENMAVKGSENVTCVSVHGSPQEPGVQFTLPCLPKSCGLNQAGLLDVSVANGEQMTGSESSKSAKRESLSETTGMEISHNELPADSENSESGVMLIEVMDTEHKSSSDKNCESCVIAKDRRQNQGIVQGLRQRQPAPPRVIARAADGGQSSPHRVGPVLDTQKPGTSAVLDRRANVNNLLEAQHGHVLGVRAQRVVTRVGTLHYPYDASFIVMVGLCLTSVFILLNRLYRIFDISHLIFN